MVSRHEIFLTLIGRDELDNALGSRKERELLLLF